MKLAYNAASAMPGLLPARLPPYLTLDEQAMNIRYALLAQRRAA